MWHELSPSYTFERYMMDFNKHYDPQDIPHRRRLFDANLRTILSHNANPNALYRMGVNHMTDWTEEERRELRGVHKGLSHRQYAERMAKVARGELKADEHSRATPLSVDWRGKGVLTTVKDQGQCGSCWSFSAAESVESHWALATTKLHVLSEQQILGCTPNPLDCGGAGGCSGGTSELAFAALAEVGGLTSEWKYPYTSWYGNDYACLYTEAKMGPPVAQVVGYNVLPPNNYRAVLEAVAFIGPLAISVDASQWHLYESGVFDGCNVTNPDIDHGVQLVGYGTTEKGVNFWIIRNSWTPDFGEDGFIRVLRDNPPVCGLDVTPLDGTGCPGGPMNVTVCGMCGVVYDASYPLVQGGGK
jgi:cathepsin L